MATFGSSTGLLLKDSGVIALAFLAAVKMIDCAWPVSECSHGTVPADAGGRVDFSLPTMKLEAVGSPTTKSNV